jgi:1,4-alpha-glucan branching enzyme
MKRHEVTPDSVHFWLEINNLDPTTEYAFQYWVDAKILTGDPYSEKILDPWNDRWINENYVAYPNLKTYPSEKTETPVTVFQIQEEEYEWKSTNFQRPNADALVFYELLVRDFAEVATYRTLIDSLGYFKRMGINAIKLMPVAEFDGNDSWGYNPAYHMALDKYYGTKNDFKEFIDSCHVNGIAVVLDVVFNHATGLSPLIRMYQDDTGAPSATSIYAFPSARHPFNVFNDLNHGSSATNYWMKRVIKHWLEEFKIDGFRFDLSKGHYIGNTTNTGVWSSYNQWRINHWKDNYNFIQSVSPGSYVVLEHLANDDEEQALAAHGLLLWGKMTDQYNELTMGWSFSDPKSRVTRSYHASRGFSTTGLVAYMESHDEERIMYKNKMFGNTSVSTHNARNLTVATQRTGTAAAFLFTIPGPKMMWMFGELGYDVSINQTSVGGPISESNRVSRKPILWEYYDDPDRQELYRRFSDLIRLRTKYPIFHDKTSSFRIFETTALRRIELAHGTNKVNIVANFDLTTRDMRFDFPETGTWYEFFSGDTLEVTDTGASYSMLPVELRIYSKEKFDLEPYSKVVTSNEEASSKLPVRHQLYANYPNPFNPTTTIQFDLPRTEMVRLEVFDVLGRQVATLVNGVRNAGSHQVQFNAQGLSSGLYLIRMQSGSFVQIQKAMLIK